MKLQTRFRTVYGSPSIQEESKISERLDEKCTWKKNSVAWGEIFPIKFHDPVPARQVHQSHRSDDEKSCRSRKGCATLAGRLTREQARRVFVVRCRPPLRRAIAYRHASPHARRIPDVRQRGRKRRRRRRLQEISDETNGESMPPSSTSTHCRPTLPSKKGRRGRVGAVSTPAFPTLIVSENPPQAAHRHDCSLFPSSLSLLLSLRMHGEDLNFNESRGSSICFLG